MASVRQRSPGRWQLIVYTGRDPLTGKDTYARDTVDAQNKKEADRKAAVWEEELRSGRTNASTGGTLNELLDRWISVRSPSWSPSHRAEVARIVDRYIRRGLGQKDAARISVHDLDDYYAALTERGGRCDHRPCKPPERCGVPGHLERCQRVTCRRDWVCPKHDGACGTWEPCDESPCQHGTPLGASTIQGVHAAISGAFTWALSTGWGGLARNPAKHTSARPEVEQDEVDPPTGSQIVELIAAAEAEGLGLATYIVLAIEAGQRRGAMHALRWKWWTGPREDGTSVIRFRRVISKGQDIAPRRSKNTGKAVTLGQHATATLARWRDHCEEQHRSAGADEVPDGAYVFSRDLGSSWWHPDATTHRVAALMAQAGIDAHLHTLRHVMATTLLSSGVPAAVVGGRGGWGELATMLGRYSHAVPADDHAAAGVIERLQPAPEPPPDPDPEPERPARGHLRLIS